VKGLVLGQTAYGDQTLRTTLDLDLLVPPSFFSSALEAVEVSGGSLRQRNWPLLARLRLGQIVVRLPLGAYGDLHWHLANTPEVRARYRIPMAEFFERRQQVNLGPLSVATLDPVDTVLHLCMHGATSGGHLLVWLMDISQSVRSYEGDPYWRWDTLVERARRYRLGLVTAVMFERARVVLGTSIPPEVISALAPHSLMVSLWSAIERQDVQHWSGTGHTGKTVLMATSSSTGATLGALARSIPRDVALPRLKPLTAALRGSTHIARPELTDLSGGEMERRQYLDTILAEALRSDAWSEPRLARDRVP
jgi:hypothetical protein